MRIVIVGAGVTGLATGYLVREQCRASGVPLSLTILERAGRTGGVIRSQQHEGCVLEAGPDSFLSDQPAMTALIRSLGLERELRYANPRCRTSFVARGRRLLAIPEGFSLLGPSRVWPFLRSPALSPRGKLRAMMEWCVPPRQDAAETDESIGAFVRRRFGRRLYEALAEPVVRGIASGNPDELSMGAVLPQFVEMESRYGSIVKGLYARRRAEGTASASGARYGLFATLRGGMQQLVDHLAASLASETIAVGVEATQVCRGSSNAWEVHLSDGTRVPADAVCLAVPAARAGALLRATDETLAGQLGLIRSSSWMTVSLGYRPGAVAHPVEGFGCVIPASESWPITGCTFMHVKFPDRVPAGHALFRMFLPCDDAAEGARPSDLDAIAVSRRFLARFLGIEQAPAFAQVFRAPGALPQYRVGHPARLAEIEARVRTHPGLTLAGNAYAGHGVAKCVASAARAATALMTTVNHMTEPCHAP